jgi:hypothetical protein
LRPRAKGNRFAGSDGKSRFINLRAPIGNQFARIASVRNSEGSLADKGCKRLTNPYVLILAIDLSSPQE